MQAVVDTYTLYGPAYTHIHVRQEESNVPKVFAFYSIAKQKGLTFYC